MQRRLNMSELFGDMSDLQRAAVLCRLLATVHAAQSAHEISDSMQLDALNMPASFLERQVNYGFSVSTTSACHRQLM